MTDVIKQTLRPGIEGLHMSASEDADITKIIGDAFNTAPGKEIMRYLETMWLHRIASPKQDGVEHTFHAGARQVVMCLRHRIMLAEKIKAKGTGNG